MDIPAGQFKAKCLQIMDQVARSRQPVTITKRGKPVAKIVPADGRIGHFGVGDCELNFYTPQLIERTFHFSCDTDSSTPRYFIARERDFDAMDAAQRSCLEPIARSAPVDSKGARLLLKEKPVVAENGFIPLGALTQSNGNGHNGNGTHAPKREVAEPVAGD